MRNDKSNYNKQYGFRRIQSQLDNLLLFVIFYLQVIFCLVSYGLAAQLNSSKITQMSRQSTIDPQEQHNQIKIQMLQSNILRLISQNKRLQQLLQYQDQFPKLQEYSSQTSIHFDKLKSLITRINNLDLEMKTQRQNFHSNINHYYEHINKNIINQIKSHKQTVSSFAEKVEEVKGRQKGMVKRYFEKMKEKYINQLQFAETERSKVISASEKQFADGVNQKIVEPLAQKIEEMMSVRGDDCRIEIAHLQNLLSYYSTPKKQDGQQKEGRVALKLKDRDEVVGVNIARMEELAQDIDAKLKGVLSDITYLQSKRRKNKRLNTKQQQSFIANKDSPIQNSKLIELGYQAEQFEHQLMGLARYCDKIALRKYQIPKKQIKQKEMVVSEKQQKSILSLNQKLLDYRAKIKEYTTFYNNFTY